MIIWDRLSLYYTVADQYFKIVVAIIIIVIIIIQFLYYFIIINEVIKKTINMGCSFAKIYLIEPLSINLK